MKRIRSSFPYPSKLWLRFMVLLKVGIAIALLVVGLSLSSCSKQNLALNGTPLKWKDAANEIPQEVLNHIMQQTTSLSSEQQKIVPFQIAHLHSKEDSVFLNFSQFPELCGELGCLMVTYSANHPQALIWSTYVSPNLPKSIPLIAQFEQQPVSSFIINQLDGNQIRQMLYTWNGSNYHLEKSMISK